MSLELLRSWGCIPLLSTSAGKGQVWCWTGSLFLEHGSRGLGQNSTLFCGTLDAGAAPCGIQPLPPFSKPRGAEPQAPQRLAGSREGLGFPRGLCGSWILTPLRLSRRLRAANPVLPVRRIPVEQRLLLPGVHRELHR